MHLKTVILRHRRENLKKCSLRGLETHPDLAFYTYPVDSIPERADYLVLKVGAPTLTEEDRNHPLLLIDATWRLAEIMGKQLPPMQARSLPAGYRTAYPRRQTGCPDPGAGLASIEALFIAHKILKKNTSGLLERYYWKELFLQSNNLAL